jgi:drug/metabolite transporter (DMT)-like permease
LNVTERQTRPVAGALWMIGAAASLVAMAILIRYLTPKYHVLELIFIRNAVNLALMIPWLVAAGFAALKTQRLGAHAMRNAFLYGGNVAWYFGVTLVPLAELAALQFTMPIFTVVMAGIVLREHIGLHRALVVGAGFAGTLIIVRPGVVDLGAGPFVVLTAAFLYSCAFIITKQLSSTDSGNQVVFYMSAFILVFSAVPAAFVWRAPDLADAAPLIAMGVSGYSTHYCVTRSMASADASYVVPFDFLRLPMSIVFGFVLFAEPLEPWTWIGAAVIFAAAYYNTRRESKLGLNPRR